MFSLYPQYTQLTMLTTKRLWKKKISVVIADEHVWDLFELAKEEEEEKNKNTHAKKQNVFFFNGRTYYIPFMNTNSVFFHSLYSIHWC